MVTTNTSSANRARTKAALEKLVLERAVGEWGCEDLTGVTIVACDRALYGRNWTVIHLQNEDLPAAGRTVLKIADQLGQRYDLAID